MMTLEQIQQQIDRAQESADKLEKDRGDLTDSGMWALGYWRGRLSVLESLRDEIKYKDMSLKI